MDKPKLVYLASLAVLGCVVVSVLMLMSLRESGRSPALERQAQLISTGPGWVLQVDLVNNGDAQEVFRVVAVHRGEVRDSQSVLLEPGRKFRYSHYFQASGTAPGEKERLYVAVYKGDSLLPVAENTYFLQ